MVYRRVVKPLLDRFTAAAALFVLLPVLLMLALAIRVRMGSPVVFRQTRIGAGEKAFLFLKFRSMTGERDSEGNLLPDELRLTPFGQFLRSSSLDELPQLWNVIRGEMSLIGPRPLLPQYLPRYSSFQKRRHEVRPGITGWAQVNGRNAISWEDKFELDVWYVDHLSARVDARIIRMTVLAVISKAGISQTGQATMAPFMGSEAPEKGRND
jgi:sugar transferase EpsL